MYGTWGYVGERTHTVRGINAQFLFFDVYGSFDWKLSHSFVTRELLSRRLVSVDDVLYPRRRSLFLFLRSRNLFLPTPRRGQFIHFRSSCLYVSLLS